MNIVNHKKTILIIIAVLIAFFVYWFVFLSKKDTKDSNTNQSSNLNAQINGPENNYDKEFVTSLLGLNSVKLNVSMFKSKEFIALNYPEVPFVIVYPKEFGRNNPFLPVGINSTILNTKIDTQNKLDKLASSTAEVVPPVKSATSTGATPGIPVSKPSLIPAPTPKNF